jgi:hypothetical protein
MTTDKAQFELINRALGSYEPRRDKHQKNLKELAKKNAEPGYKPLIDASAYVEPFIAGWEAGVTYDPGTVVIHQGNRYLKLDDGDNSEPDAIAGGWEQV